MRGVAGVRDSEGFGKAVVGDGEAKEFGGDGVGFGVVEDRETRDKCVPRHCTARAVQQYTEQYSFFVVCAHFCGDKVPI